MVRGAWPDIQTDALGEFAVVEVDRSVFSDTVVCKTAYWLTDQYYVYVSALSGERLAVELREKRPGTSSNLRKATGDFCNSLIDYRIRETVLEQTRGVREALIRKAFFEGMVSRGLPGIASNEEHVPDAYTDYRVDPVKAGRFDG